ncbi:MAG TPA: aspartate-semialdehyde dehydrogenase, partial [Phycisphaerae bacterium]|nr:aspartate-semialdehyde dehydrogenase [Phycisphaerae bacterium]
MFDCVAVVGATGAVGREFISLLETRGFKARAVRLLASRRSAGQRIRLNGDELVVEELTADSFKGVDLAFFSAGGGVSKEFAPVAARAGCVVVDNSSAFRMDPATPLIVPEVNPDDTRQHQGILANPNCSTIIMVVPVWPLHRANPIKRIIASTYQAASGAGQAVMDELADQTRDVLAGKPAAPRLLPFQYAFNLFSHNSAIGENGYNVEEMKMIHETHKMFHDDAIRIAATCVRVPVMRAHSEALNLEFTNPITPDEVRAILADAPGVKVVDQREPQHFPMPIEASGQDDVLVGRIREDLSGPAGHSITMFIAGDQLRKGAALNGI